MEKTVVITGAAGGIGLAAAKLFLASGWRVFGVDKKETAPSLAGMIYLRSDLSNVSMAEDTFKNICEKAGRIDALVNNAALQICKPVSEMYVSEWDEVMAVNSRAVFIAVRSILHYLNFGACIVNVSSVHAIATSSNMAAYASSKGAISTLTRALAVELAPRGIRVNAVLPGAIDTSMLREGLENRHLGGSTVEEGLETLAGKTPLGRIGKPDEVAQSVLFLADSERSSFITGESLVVDGGATAKLSTE